MWGFEHYGMGWGMMLVWLIPILLVAAIVLARCAAAMAHPGIRHWRYWSGAMPVAKLTAKSF